MKSTKENVKDINLLEGMFKGLINKGVNPKSILIALQNVCAHGEAIEEYGGDLDEDDKILGEIFHGFDITQKAMKKSGL